MVRLSTIKGYEMRLDRVEARRALDLLIDPTDCHELRGLPSGRSRLACGADLDAALLAAAALADEAGLYITVNPVRPELGNRAATNRDIVSRKRLYIDVDPVRPKGTNATEAEHEAARVVAEAIAADLSARGWPSPILVDSGSGWHLHYSVDLPNDRLAQQLIRAFLRALAARHDTDGVKVDPGVHNAARIARLPGTVNRKGEATPDRPQRPCRLVSVPIAITPVPVEFIRDYAGPEPEPRNGHASPGSVRDHIRRMTAEHSAYARSALEREAGKVATTSINRNDQLYESAVKLGGYVAGGSLTEAEVRDALTRAAKAAGLGEDGDPKEVERAITNGLEVGKETPKQPPEPKAEKGGKGKSKAEAVDPGARLIVLASEIIPRKVEFLWPGRIPIGKMTTFAGQGGLGKTFVLCDIAARVTTGEEWPFGDGQCAEPGRVLFISGEDDEDDTLVPRMIECGADLSRIAFMAPAAHDNFTLAALELLGSMLDQLGDDVRFVAIDPPTSYLGGVDDHKNAELRGLLTPLKRWAADRRVAIILNNHVNKSVGPNVDAAARVMGSVAWVNAVRAAHMFIRDPEDKDRVLFVPLKINIAKRPLGLSYRIIPTTDDLAKVEWLGTVDQTADEAIRQDRRKPREKSAREWLIDIFRQQREWSSEQFWASAKEHGVTKYAIDLARLKLSIPKPRRTVGVGGDIMYTWYVRPDWPYLFADGDDPDRRSANRDDMP